MRSFFRGLLGVEEEMINSYPKWCSVYLSSPQKDLTLVVKKVCHTISLCEDSWSSLQLDFANKKTKHDKLSGHLRGCSPVPAAFTSVSRLCPHVQGSTCNRLCWEGPWHSHSPASLCKTWAMDFKEDVLRANWLAWLAFAHKGLLGIFKEPVCHLPQQKSSKGVQIIFLFV